ncbi:terminase gpA endonuclease subunit [Cereibacter johrii]|uniref:terminase gpA endonuclease subunit n=1 Tax=Cereibacter johrii TaxID=445629 RepID=UPI000DCD2093|nr:terminase gpA endonuclease subunit [Cereibacter johrii]RAZ84052.1 hypothetical protein DDV93_13950 [Cereibacter johrii]
MIHPLTRAEIDGAVLECDQVSNARVIENVTRLFEIAGSMIGRRMGVAAVALDSGDHYTQEAYDWTARNVRAGRLWWAIKGHSQKATKTTGRRGDRIWPQAISDNGKSYSVEVDVAKDVIYRRLHSDPSEPGGIIFPAGSLPAGAVQCDTKFFTRLTRERPIPVKGQPGKTFWSDPVDQEPWDCLVYAMAAMHGLRQAYPAKYGPMVASPVKRAPPPATAPAADVATAAPAIPKPRHAPKPRPVAKTPSWLRL